MKTFTNPIFNTDDRLVWKRLSTQCLLALRCVGSREIRNGVTRLKLDSGILPTLDDLNDNLRDVNWTITPVTGFISSKVFLESLSRRCLPISVKMRNSEQLDFSAEPDYFHEAFGHVAMLGCEEIRDLLEDYGKLGLKCFSYSSDDQYLEKLKDNIEIRKNHNGLSNPIIFDIPEKDVSELIQLTRLGWWTFETGVILQNRSPKVWGAALTSSLSEMTTFSKKPISPLTIDCIWKHFDPSTHQSSYHYIESFSDARRVLKEFEKNIAANAGGLHSCSVALKAGKHCSIKMSDLTLIKGKIMSIVESRVLVNVSNENHYVKDVELPISNIIGIEPLMEITNV